jgi:hypothetical protein
VCFEAEQQVYCTGMHAIITSVQTCSSCPLSEHFIVNKDTQFQILHTHHRQKIQHLFNSLNIVEPTQCIMF